LITKCEYAFARGERIDPHDIHAVKLEAAVADEQCASEPAFLQALTQRGNREIVVHAVDAAERHAIEIWQRRHELGAGDMT
jgi:hypothetical protein